MSFYTLKLPRVVTFDGGCLIPSPSYAHPSCELPTKQLTAGLSLIDIRKL